MSSIIMVPLNKLVLSQANVRRTDRKPALDALAASIDAHGLLQNLAVTAREDGKYEVVAGGRRLGALKLLVKQGKRAKDWPTPCQLVSGDAAGEASLAENIQRVDMNVMDEVEAFADLIDAGLTAEAVAHRFGTTLRHVEQRLALARLSPAIRQAYRKGDITLDVARAFCLNADHEAQERVFAGMSKPISSAYAVRAALSQGRTPLDDRIALFVGVEAYAAAGGHIVKDLFEESVVFLEDGELLQKLALSKAMALRGQLLGEGWGWVEIELGHGGLDGYAAERLRPQQRKFTSKERKQIAALDAEISALDEALEAGDEHSEEDSEAAQTAWSRRDDAEAERDAILEAARVYDPSMMTHAGALIGVGRDGQPVISRGLIRRTDLRAIAKIRKSSACDVSENEASPDAPAQGLSKALLHDLSIARTRAIRHCLARAPHHALALLIFALHQQSAGLGDVAGLGLASSPRDFEDEAPMKKLLAKAPVEPQLEALLQASTDDLLSWLAVFVAQSVDLTHDGFAPRDRERRQSGDSLSAALDLDMSAFWRADEAFWSRAPRPLALEAVASAPALVASTPAARTASMKRFAKMKKSELATAVAEMLKDVAWLPQYLITPPREGAFALTPAGKDACEAAAASSR